MTSIDYAPFDALQVVNVPDNQVSEYISIDLDVDDDDIAYVIDEADIELQPAELLAFAPKGIVETLSEAIEHPIETPTVLQAGLSHWASPQLLPHWISPQSANDAHGAKEMGCLS